MKNLQIFFLIALLSPAGFIEQIRAQTVSTFLTGNALNGPDGFALDGEQNLYVANCGGGAGTTVLKITPGVVVSKVRCGPAQDISKPVFNDNQHFHGVISPR